MAQYEVAQDTAGTLELVRVRTQTMTEYFNQKNYTVVSHTVYIDQTRGMYVISMIGKAKKTKHTSSKHDQLIA